MGRQAAHQAEASGKKLVWERARHWHHDARTAFNGGRADAAREEIAKASQAGETDFHADLGD
jgi:hypothetical protein